jgi:Tol biopolymer transport system component
MPPAPTALSSRLSSSYAKARFASVRLLLGLAAVWSTGCAPVERGVSSQPAPIAPTAAPPTRIPEGAINEQTQIAYVWTDDREAGEYNLYTMRPNGRGRHRLTSFPGIETSPAWSPDGKSIAFVGTLDSVNPADCATGFVEIRCVFAIYTVQADGTGLKRISPTDSFDRDPSWSPDGKRIAFSSREPNHRYGFIYTINADGSDPVQLTRGRVCDLEPAWSPDGRHIAFTRCKNDRYDIYVMDADGGNITQLTHEDVSNVKPAWSPDGQYIAWVALEGDPTYAEGRLKIMRHDGSEITAVPLDVPVSASYLPTWSPDGQELFIVSQSPQYTLYRVRRDGSRSSRMSSGGGFMSSPAWSPLLSSGGATP